MTIFLHLSSLPAFLQLVFQPLFYAQTGFLTGAWQTSGLYYWSTTYCCLSNIVKFERRLLKSSTTSHYMVKLIFVTPSRYRMLDWRQNVGDFNFLICLAPEIPEILGIWGESITAMYFSHFGRSLYWIGVTLDKTQKFFNAWIRTSDGRVEIALPLTIILKQKWLSHTNKPFYMK